MAGEQTRTFTEGEAYALVEDAVQRETAAAKAEATAALEQVTAISNEKDALELRVTAAEEAKAKAEQELAEFKESIEREKAQEALRVERLAKVTEVAPKLDLTSEKDGVARANRIVAMADEAFDEYVETIRQVAGESGDDKTPPGDLPRESAAFKGGKPGAGSSAKTPVTGLFAAKRAASRPRASA